jgi:hypothetical protein
MPRYRTTMFRRIERLIMSKHDLWCTNYKIVLSPTTIDYYGPWYTDLWSATKCFISCCSASSPDWTSCRECLGAPGRYHFLLQQTPSARGISERFPAARSSWGHRTWASAPWGRMTHLLPRRSGSADLLREHVRERGAEPIRYRRK